MSLEQKLGYTFKDPTLLEQALCHSSYGHEFLKNVPKENRDNERLEFLGDSILGMVVASLLFNKFPNEPEGKLTCRRSDLVCARGLSDIAKTIELERFLKLGTGEAAGPIRVSILSSAFEAVIGAIYLDGGFEAASDVINTLFTPLLDTVISVDYKTKLQNFVQSKTKQQPRYTVVSIRGPDHAKVFESAVLVDGRTLATGSGSSRKASEHDAAFQAMMSLGLSI